MAKHLPDGRGTDQFNDQNKSTGTGVNEYDLRPAENRGNEQISSVKKSKQKTSSVSACIFPNKPDPLSKARIMAEETPTLKM